MFDAQPTDTAAGQVHTYEVLPFVIVPRIHFGKAEAAHGLILRGVATHWNRIFYRIFLRVIIYEFGLRTSMNYTENVAELLAHARTADTRRSSPIFSSGWERG